MTNWIKFSEVYSVSSDGQIRNDLTGRIRKTSPNKLGYHRFSFKSKDGRHVSKTCHRLVALAFIPNPNNHPEVNHIDGNKSNNSVSNLEWVTKSENERHAMRTGLKRIGQDRPNSKLRNEQVLAIRSEYSANQVTLAELARKYGVVMQSIHSVVTKKTYKNV